jgi:glutamate racemase
VGGLTVARAIMDQLPHERIIYVGDTAHGPYGPLKIAEVRANALRIMDELVDSGVKMLVIACNTASAAVLRDARERYTRHYGIPVIEVIQPAARRALAATRNRKIGVIATEATVTSRALRRYICDRPEPYGAVCRMSSIRRVRGEGRDIRTRTFAYCRRISAAP